ncbi:MAG TPA: ATP-binding protein [Candidatus Anaerostipes avistercoris]|uniref:ATP-binding protein n=1 Tax=Candidatus Anaerostipes avistercoris TaxID=2838462 RepID=A0A9D2PH32_9FIRM|nr:ATP-binding protein [Candidatus Anaerostipes avistercoris]
MKKKLAIGIENYKELIDKSYYYVDKTLLIQSLLDDGNKVTLFTRPRRFGKTLTLSMLKTFFENEMDWNGKQIENAYYFNNMKIISTGEEYLHHMGKYPVISLSLKAAKQPTFQLAHAQLCEQISNEFSRHRYVLQSSQLLEHEKNKYENLMSGTADEASYVTALKFLSDCLKAYHKENVIVLLDEYDVPLENAYFRGFYDQMTDFIRSLFESVLKSNDSLEFAVITGCLRISKESIFTGLNNLKIISVLSQSYAEYFGFTPNEVQEMLAFYHLSEKQEEISHWYDGYLFGETEVYNPWSVINYISDMIKGDSRFPKPYWSNTSSNNIIRTLIEVSDSSVKQEIEGLIAGHTIEKPVYEDITYEDVYKSQDNLWNFLFFTGYLKSTGQRFEIDTIYVTMKIPNEEIRYIYRTTIREWFQEKIKASDYHIFYQDILAGNCTEIETFINDQLSDSISYYDNAENFYHGYLLGVLGGIPAYEIDSNKEHGNGRPDLILKPNHPEKPAAIIELKRVSSFKDMKPACTDALKQIEEKHYAKDLEKEGYTNILKYGICFCKKSCMVILSE